MKIARTAAAVALMAVNARSLAPEEKAAVKPATVESVAAELEALKARIDEREARDPRSQRGQLKSILLDSKHRAVFLRGLTRVAKPQDADDIEDPEHAETFVEAVNFRTVVTTPQRAYNDAERKRIITGTLKDARDQYDDPATGGRMDVDAQAMRLLLDEVGYGGEVENFIEANQYVPKDQRGWPLFSMDGKNWSSDPAHDCWRVDPKAYRGIKLPHS